MALLLLPFRLLFAVVWLIFELLEAFVKELTRRR
jgi:hypothetical protein